MKGLIFDIQRFSTKDGPGIRTTIFLKGCPLKCLWCHNPESQSFDKELMYYRQRCIECGLCEEICKHKVHQLNPRKIYRYNCVCCGDCVDECSVEALKLVGQYMTVDEVIEIAKKDFLYYSYTEGGITISGGEPFSQEDFTLELCKRLKELDINTAVDTCGYAKWDKIEKTLPYIDYLLFDIKHMDNDKHKRITGVYNEIILDNLSRAAKANINLIVRFPLIPDINDDKDNIINICTFLNNNDIDYLELILYHNYGDSKYEQLGITNNLTNIKTPRTDHINNIVNIIEDYNIKFKII